jgi:hypothetical protein
MKNLSFLNVLFLALAIFGISSCGSDDTPVNLGPDVSFGTGTDITSDDADVAPGATFTVRLIVSKGDSPLKSLTINEAGTAISADRIVIDGIATANNPQLITGADVDGFTWDITVTAHSDDAEVEYEFVVTDENNEPSTASLLINTIGQGTPPTVTLVGTATLTVVPNTAVNIKISATPGSSDLATVSVFEGGTLISDLSRLDYDGAGFTDNPQPLSADDMNGFTELPITVRVGNTGAVYTFEVTDASGLNNSVTVTINTGTAASEIIGVLLNQAGPAGTGGLDLDAGNSTGSMDASAEIRDRGIDNSLPTADNWIQKISGTNNAIVKYAGNLPDGSNYEDITTQEEIQGAFANSVDLSGGISDVVVVGDEFVVERDGKYYFLLVTDITVTSNNNADSYTFSIKR